MCRFLWRAYWWWARFCFRFLIAALLARWVADAVERL